MIRPHRVNYRDLTILSAFYDVWGEDAEKALHIVNPDDRNDVIRAIREHVVPKIMAVEGRSPGFVNRLRHSLKYFINGHYFPIEEVYNAEEPVFRLPATPLDYYVWAWEAIFSGENWQTSADETYEEEIDHSPP